MNADVEGDRSKSAVMARHTGSIVGQLASRRKDVVSIKLPTAGGTAIHRGGYDVLPARLLSHGAVLLLLGLTLLLGQLWWARWSSNSASPTQTFTKRLALLSPGDQNYTTEVDGGFVERQMPPETVEDQLAVLDESVELGRGGSTFAETGFVTRGIDPEGSLIPIARTDVVMYSVQYGDTLWDIAAKFNIAQATLRANNNLRNPDLLTVGDELIIPPIDGLIYKVRRGDTLEILSKRYKTTVEAIVSFSPNRLSEGDELVIGQQIIIPGGIASTSSGRGRAVVRPAGVSRGTSVGDGGFVMPTSGTFTQRFHKRHPGIDIGAPKGAPVYAADAGRVTFAGWHPSGYGYAVEIDHGNGYRTLYAHLSWYAPDTGQFVKRGELIGGVGSTYGSGGWSSGPHLHFEIIKNGIRHNPCSYIVCP